MILRTFTAALSRLLATRPSSRDAASPTSPELTEPAPVPCEEPVAPDWRPEVQNEPASPVHLMPDWYLGRYPEAAAAIADGGFADAVDHYLRAGAAGGLDPNPVFSETYYLDANPEVAERVASGRYLSGFQHFVLNGQHEGRRCLELEVDEAWYLETYPDAAEAVAQGRVASAFIHYLVQGAAEARDPHAAFDEIWYRHQHPRVAQDILQGQLLSGYQHFRRGHPDRSATPHPAYSERSYRKTHPEVARAIQAGEHPSGYLHLVRCGLFEGRRWRRPTPLRHLVELERRRAGIELSAFLAHDRTLALPSSEEPTVSVVIVAFNQADLVLRCLESVSRIQDPPLEIIVVDNASTDATRIVLERIRGAVVLHNAENTGFLEGSNLGASAARAPHVLFLNSDAVVSPGAIAAALRRLASDAGIGAVGGCLVRPDGLLQEAGAFLWRDGSIEPYGAGDHPLSGAYRFARQVDYCSAAFLLVRAEAFRALGGFDSAFRPGYYEDVDLCLRLYRDLRLTTMYEPAAIVHHLGSGSETSTQRTEDLARRNRLVLLDRLRAEPGERPSYDPGVVVRESRKDRFQTRVLILDDLPPSQHLGSGAPRLVRILEALADVGAFTTLFVANPTDLDLVPEQDVITGTNLEVIRHVGRDGLTEFLRGREGLYTHVIVSRLHNLKWWLHKDTRVAGATLIYDAEAVVAPRVAAQARVLGSLPTGQEPVTEDEECRLVSNTDEVWAVSELDAEALRPAGRRIRLVTHAESPRRNPPGFDGREGLVFVGRLREEGSPNVDGLRWFVRHVMPEVRRRLGRSPRLRVIGELGEIDLPVNEDVEMAGRIDDLAPELDRAILLVAPARFAAGIPLKVVTAAAHGLPAVASSMLVRQLGWRHAEEVFDGGADPENFATTIVAALSDRESWQRVQQGALDRVRSDFASERLRSAVAESLGLSG